MFEKKNSINPDKKDGKAPKTAVYALRNVDELTANPRNARTHSDAQIDKIAASIREFGFISPAIIDAKGVLIAGHGRLAASKKLGLTEIPCILAGHLSEAQAKAYMLADNRIQDDSEWDDDLLKVALGELSDLNFDLTITGFESDEISDFLADPVVLGDEDEVPAAPVIPVSKMGETWLLGAHRLRCGDSTSEGDYRALMNGFKPDMVFTDPPYNIDYQGVKDKREKIANDKMDDTSFLIFLRQSIPSCPILYVCCSWQFSHLFKQALSDIGCAAKAMIVWNKINPAQHLDLYFKQHEIIYYHGPFGGVKTKRGDIWETKRQQNPLHPTMKPVELIEMALEDQPKAKIVYDGFGGSGSTLIACEKSGKQCFMMELNPAYIDVIIRRFQEFTGKKATRESDGAYFDNLQPEGVAA